VAEAVADGVRRWFVTLPRVAARVSRGLAFSLADGHFLAAVPPVAAWAAPALGVLGFAGGALTLGYERVFSEALWIVLVAAAAGCLATSLGVAFTAGFAAGDFLVGQRQWSLPLVGDLLAGILRFRLPMLIGYALLAALAVLLPRLARALIADIPRTERLPKTAAFAILTALNVIILGVAVRLWAESSAVLVRPLFTWQGTTPTAVAVSTLQERSAWVVTAAVVAAIGRSALLWWVYAREERTRAVLEVEQAVAEGPGRTPLLERFGPALGSIGSAAVTTFVLAGVIERWWTAAVVFAVFLVLRLLRQGVIPPRLEGWKRTAARVPVLLRLALALLVADTLRRAFVDEFDVSFTRLALYLAASAVVLYLLLPGEPAEAPA
jgi:hypothetical protein